MKERGCEIANRQSPTARWKLQHEKVRPKSGPAPCLKVVAQRVLVRTQIRKREADGVGQRKNCEGCRLEAWTKCLGAGRVAGKAVGLGIKNIPWIGVEKKKGIVAGGRGQNFYC